MTLNGIHGFVRHGICEVLLRRAGSRGAGPTLTSEEVTFLPSSLEGRKVTSSVVSVEPAPRPPARRSSTSQIPWRTKPWMPFNVIIYLKTISNIIELYKINILSKIMSVSNYLFVVIINFVRPLTICAPNATCDFTRMRNRTWSSPQASED